MDPRTEEGRTQLQAWLQGQLEGQARYVVAKELVTGNKARAYAAWALPGKLCIGRLVSVNNKAQAYWVISGECPTDELELKLAATPRDAARHFALKWQLMAARLGDSSRQAANGESDTWSQVGGKLAAAAEQLYRLAADDKHWVTQPPDAGAGSGTGAQA